MWSKGDFDWTTYREVEMTRILSKHLVEHMLFKVTKPIIVLGASVHPTIEGFSFHMDYIVE